MERMKMHSEFIGFPIKMDVEILCHLKEDQSEILEMSFQRKAVSNNSTSGCRRQVARSSCGKTLGWYTETSCEERGPFVFF